MNFKLFPRSTDPIPFNRPRKVAAHQSWHDPRWHRVPIGLARRNVFPEDSSDPPASSPRTKLSQVRSSQDSQSPFGGKSQSPMIRSASNKLAQCAHLRPTWPATGSCLPSRSRTKPTSTPSPETKSCSGLIAHVIWKCSTSSPSARTNPPESRPAVLSCPRSPQTSAVRLLSRVGTLASSNTPHADGDSSFRSSGLTSAFHFQIAKIGG